MAYDEGAAELMREDLADLHTISERKMFGGLCFMLNGNMLCGIHKGGAMYRVGKDNHDEAKAIEGASDMAFTGRKMGGMIDVDEEGFADDAKRAEWLRLAVDFVSTFPPK